MRLMPLLVVERSLSANSRAVAVRSARTHVSLRMTQNGSCRQACLPRCNQIWHLQPSLKRHKSPSWPNRELLCERRRLEAYHFLTWNFPASGCSATPHR